MNETGREEKRREAEEEEEEEEGKKKIAVGCDMAIIIIAGQLGGAEGSWSAGARGPGPDVNWW